MPVVFGPSRMEAVTVSEHVRTTALSFLTTEESIKPLIPYHFDTVPDPVVTIVSLMNSGVDHMAGRSYNAVGVMVDVIAHGENGPFRAPYHLVIWENDCNPIIAGREFQGYAKIFGEIPDHRYEGDRASFELREYGNRLLEVEVSGLQDVPDEELQRIRSVNRSVMVGWKYITGPGNACDADYPTMLVAYPEVQSARRGVGRLSLDEPTWEQCPTSSRIINVLRKLPIVEMRPAMVTTGKVKLARDEVIRLPVTRTNA